MHDQADYGFLETAVSLKEMFDNEYCQVSIVGPICTAFNLSFNLSSYQQTAIASQDRPNDCCEMFCLRPAHCRVNGNTQDVL